MFARPRRPSCDLVKPRGGHPTSRSLIRCSRSAMRASRTLLRRSRLAAASAGRAGAGGGGGVLALLPAPPFPVGSAGLGRPGGASAGRHRAVATVGCRWRTARARSRECRRCPLHLIRRVATSMILSPADRLLAFGETKRTAREFPWLRQDVLGVQVQVIRRLFESGAYWRGGGAYARRPGVPSPPEVRRTFVYVVAREQEAARMFRIAGPFPRGVSSIALERRLG